MDVNPKNVKTALILYTKPIDAGKYGCYIHPTGRYHI